MTGLSLLAGGVSSEAAELKRLQAFQECSNPSLYLSSKMTDKELMAGVLSAAKAEFGTVKQETAYREFESDEIIADGDDGVQFNPNASSGISINKSKQPVFVVINQEEIPKVKKTETKSERKERKKVKILRWFKSVAEIAIAGGVVGAGSFILNHRGFYDPEKAGYSWSAGFISLPLLLCYKWFSGKSKIKQLGRQLKTKRKLLPLKVHADNAMTRARLTREHQKDRDVRTMYNRYVKLVCGNIPDEYTVWRFLLAGTVGTLTTYWLHKLNKTPTQKEYLKAQLQDASKKAE
jgi:hypothetical protein